MPIVVHVSTDFKDARIRTATSIVASPTAGDQRLQTFEIELEWLLNSGSSWLGR